MEKTIQLSNRLKYIASFLPKGTVFADIGSDHAYLPCYVCLHDQNAKAIAGEINQGPYNSAKQTIDHYGLHHAVEVRLGDGLQVLKKTEVDHIVIAGMGGSLIRTILEQGKDKLDVVKRIIVQPNIDEKDARIVLENLGYTITNELIFEENGHIYEIIVGDLLDPDQIYRPLSEKQLLFGPILLEKRNDYFIRKWNSVKEKHLRIKKQMENAQQPPMEKIHQLEKELKWIKEVLYNDNPLN